MTARQGSGGRALLLAVLADEFMRTGQLPAASALPGLREIRAQLYPPPPATPAEVRFAARWPGIVIVAARMLPEPGHLPWAR